MFVRFQSPIRRVPRWLSSGTFCLHFRYVLGDVLEVLTLSIMRAIMALVLRTRSPFETSIDIRLRRETTQK